MMRMSVTRLNKGAMKRFAERMPKQANFIVSKIALRLAEYIREQKLSGQVLRERSQAERARHTKRGRMPRTRSTKESTRFFKLKSGRFGVRPGSRIGGRLNYLLGKRFERGDRPFMRPAWKEFRSRKTHIQIAQGYMDRFIREENRGSQATHA